jgi:tetratricopeptide (TPR) repeat protein
MSEIQSGANNTFQRATQLQREGRLEEAIALYREAIEKNPNFAWYYYYLGEALIALGDPKEAIECYRKAVEISPESGWFNNRLSFRLATKTRLDSNWIITLDKYEKKIYSQSGEDGIIERIFEKIGIINKLAVEFGEPNGGKNS